MVVYVHMKVETHTLTINKSALRTQEDISQENSRKAPGEQVVRGTAELVWRARLALGSSIELPAQEHRGRCFPLSLLFITTHGVLTSTVIPTIEQASTVH